MALGDHLPSHIRKLSRVSRALGSFALAEATHPGDLSTHGLRAASLSWPSPRKRWWIGEGIAERWPRLMNV